MENGHMGDTEAKEFVPPPPIEPGKMPPDDRPIETMAFGALKKDIQEREDERAWVLATLVSIGAKVADDISRIGCVGAVAKCLAIGEMSGVEPGKNLSSAIDGAKRLRDGVGGGGVGLTCYVPKTLYCLVHCGAGSLQEGQEQRYSVAEIARASRALTDKERGYVDAVEHFKRRTKGMGAERAFEEAARVTREGAVDQHAPIDEPRTVASPSYQPEDGWECPEHDKPYWPCRFCVAAEIVRGALVPEFLITDQNGDIVPVKAPDGIEEQLRQQAEHQEVTLYVRAARWVRKLALV